MFNQGDGARGRNSANGGNQRLSGCQPSGLTDGKAASPGGVIPNLLGMTPAHSPPAPAINGPVRVQLSRAKGWRMPDNTVKVDRTTRHGNPFVCHRKNDQGRLGCLGAMTDKPMDGEYCCLKTFREWIASAVEGRDSFTGSLMAGLDGANGYPARNAYVARIAELRGKNLACWCKLDAPCHADVLLELANREPSA